MHLYVCVVMRGVRPTVAGPFHIRCKVIPTIAAIVLLCHIAAIAEVVRARRMQIRGEL